MNYLTLAKYGAISAVLIGVGVWLGGYPERLKYARLQAEYSALQAEYSAFQIQVAHEREVAQKAATDALEAQIAARNATEEHNAQIISQLQSQADHAAADRDFARRLLAAVQARSAASSDPSPKAESGQPVDAAPQSGGNQSVAQLLGPTAGECRDAINQLIALQAEIRPQL